MEKFKVGIIEPIGGYGGMDYYDYGLACGLGENNIEVLLFTSNDTVERRYKNVHTYFYFVEMWRSNLFKKSFKYLYGHIRAFKKLKKVNAKLVHLHFFTFRSIDLIILFLAKLFRLPVYLTIHDVNSFYKGANIIIEKLCYKLAKGIIVHNKASAKALSEKHSKIQNVTIINHGNYLPFIDKKKNNKQEVFTLLFFGQIKTVKGIDILLKGLKLVQEKGYIFKLIIAGRPWKNDVKEYISLIDTLGLNNYVQTEFKYIKDEDIANYYSLADLVVLPYKEIYQSGVLLLTMSYSVPVLCSNLEPFKEIIVDKKNGFIFESEDVIDLSKKIIEIMENPDLLHAVILESDNLIRSEYSWFKIGYKTKEFYNKTSIKQS